jgi:PAS domain-containing protein
LDERRRTAPTDLAGYLYALPALLLLDRLPTAMLGVGPSGEIAYANLACAEMLGYIDGEAVTHLALTQLLTGHSMLEPGDCVTTLQTAEGIVGWNHFQGYVVRTMVSKPLLVRASDPLLLLSITDVTEWHWESSARPGDHQRNGHSP